MNDVLENVIFNIAIIKNFNSLYDYIYREILCSLCDGINSNLKNKIYTEIKTIYDKYPLYNKENIHFLKETKNNFIKGII